MMCLLACLQCVGSGPARLEPLAGAGVEAGSSGPDYNTVSITDEGFKELYL